jgi:hypothetical protein
MPVSVIACGGSTKWAISETENDGQTGGTKGKGFHFVQISASHIGFNKLANADVNTTLQVAIEKSTGCPRRLTS